MFPLSPVSFSLGALVGMLLMAILEGLFIRRESKRIQRLTAPRVTQPALDQAHGIDRALHCDDTLPCEVEAQP